MRDDAVLVAKDLLSLKAVANGAVVERALDAGVGFREALCTDDVRVA
jgi:hypothetical protein